MARPPVDESNPGREAIWAAVRGRNGNAFCVSEITGLTGANDKTARDYFKGLTAAGYLQQQPIQPGAVARWLLVRDIGVEAPRVRSDGTAVEQGSITERLWRGMYMQKEFTYLDLLDTTSTSISVETAKSYCQMLLATGYLRVLEKADPVRGRIARYRLIRNNGPKPPQIQRVKRVYDPNTREVFMPEARL
ncbi:MULTISPECIES: hypothetical protein [unclassified Tabrizicola]|uniref:hypothetical protein n=1 Tax=unclassified Tabrizicola TaxID=2620214 RepID=UPI00157454FE|nr:hypothetical protein [Tabrizicola sp. SY72]NTT88526.1 hypothetical protein [Tabrizicola sp. SY72]